MRRTLQAPPRRRSAGLTLVEVVVALAVLSLVVLALGASLRGISQSALRVDILTAPSMLPQAEATLQSALAGYETGKVDFATLLDAQRQIRKSRVDRLKAQVEAQVRLAAIERLLGEDL